MKGDPQPFPNLALADQSAQQVTVSGMSEDARARAYERDAELERAEIEAERTSRITISPESMTKLLDMTERAVRVETAAKLKATRGMWQSEWILRDEAVKIALGEDSDE